MRQNFLYALALATSLGVVSITAGCTDNQIGRLCNDPNQIADGGTKSATGVNVVSPAADCPARLCLTTQDPTTLGLTTPTGVTRAAGVLSVCTAECKTDDDCSTSSGYKSSSTCTSYKCSYPSVIPTDGLCCKKVCMCEADIPAFARNPTSGKPLVRDTDGVLEPDVCRMPTACMLPP